MKNVPTPGTWVRKQRAGIIPEIILLESQFLKKLALEKTSEGTEWIVMGPRALTASSGLAP